jgi:hypothetical protein
MLVSDEQARFSDNYFDLAGGEAVDITITSPSALQPEMVRCAWR